MAEPRLSYDVQTILTRLAALKNPLESAFYYPVLLEAHGLLPEVPEADALAILQRCIPKALSTADPSDSLKQQLQHEKQKFLATPERDLVLLTSISVKRNLLPRRVRLLDTELRFSKRAPKSFSSAWVTDKLKQHSIPTPPADHSACRVFVRARTSREAMDRGHFVLDFFRGCTNFVLGLHRRSLTLYGSPEKPRGVVMSGPTYTVHEPSGALVTEELGVNDAFGQSRGALDEVLKASVAKQSRVRATVRGSNWPAELTKAFVQLARALDASDSESCLLKLWALLEYLTGAGTHHDKVVSRATALFRSEEPKRSVLQHLRAHRGKIVHASHESEFTHLLVNNLLDVANELLIFHLAQGRQFASMTDACQLLDLPPHVDKLQATIRLYKTALRYRMRDAS